MVTILSRQIAISAHQHMQSLLSDTHLNSSDISEHGSQTGLRCYGPRKQRSDNMRFWKLKFWNKSAMENAARLKKAGI